MPIQWKRFWGRYDWPLHVPAAVNTLTCRLADAWFTFVARLKLWFHCCRVGPGLRVDGRMIVCASRRGAIVLGSQVRFISRHGANLVGLQGPVILHSIADGRIAIGDHSGGSSVVISSRASVSIGQRALMGGNVRIYDHDYHSVEAENRREPLRDAQHVRSRPVRIGDDVFIGTNAIILKGVSIGDRSIIGAGSVVSCDVPADEVWAGNPARRVKSLLDRTPPSPDETTLPAPQAREAP